MIGHYVDIDTQEFFKFNLETPEVEQATVGLGRYQEVDAAVVGVLPSRYRSENPDPVDATVCRQLPDLLPIREYPRQDGWVWTCIRSGDVLPECRSQERRNRRAKSLGLEEPFEITLEIVGNGDRYVSHHLMLSHRMMLLMIGIPWLPVPGAALRTDRSRSWNR